MQLCTYEKLVNDGTARNSWLMIVAEINYHHDSSVAEIPMVCQKVVGTDGTALALRVCVCLCLCGRLLMDHISHLGSRTLALRFTAKVIRVFFFPSAQHPHQFNYIYNYPIAEHNQQTTVRRCQLGNVQPCDLSRNKAIRSGGKKIDHCSVCSTDGCNGAPSASAPALGAVVAVALVVAGTGFMTSGRGRWMMHV